MSPRVGGYGRQRKARGWRAADQARRGLLVLALAGMPACTERVAELDPRPALSNLFFATHLEGREPPPGLDQPWPNLSSVPARPTPPDAATRAGISAGLVQDREQSRAPLAPSPRGSRPPAEAGPPPPARLAAVPPIRPEPPAAGPAPAAAPAPLPSTGTAPAPEPLRPPPPPARDLLAPPPPPSQDLLAPRRD